MRDVGRWVAPVVCASCVGALVGVLGVTGRDAEVVAARATAPAVAGPALVEGDWPVGPVRPTHPTSFLVADAAGPSVDLYESRGAAVAVGLDNPTWEGLAVVFLVLEQEGDWLHVRVSTRPNGRTAWVRADQVRLRRVPNWIKVEIAARRVTVLHGDTPLLSTIVAVGKDATPTPVGTFFVDGLVPLEPPHRAYGAGQVSVSGFSPTLESFGGGVGQIALHGTFATSLLGEPTSNGCVRMDNDAIRAVMRLAPTGTPVEIGP
jgi:lipoprotein-anchoring transpeptidase ErfK/SrfK